MEYIYICFMRRILLLLVLVAVFGACHQAAKEPSAVLQEMNPTPHAQLVHLSADKVRALLLAEPRPHLAGGWYSELPAYLQARLPRNPDPSAFELGSALLARSLIAADPASVRTQAEAWARSRPPAQRQSLGMDALSRWAELSIARGLGDHYIFPVYYRAQKVAEVWAPAWEVVEVRGLHEATEDDVDVLSYYRIFPEVREIMSPGVALTRSGLLLENGASAEDVELYYFGSNRYGLVPVYAVPSRLGLRLVEAHAGHVKIFVVRPGIDASGYVFQGRPVEIVEASQ